MNGSVKGISPWQGRPRENLGIQRRGVGLQLGGAPSYLWLCGTLKPSAGGLCIGCQVIPCVAHTWSCPGHIAYECFLLIFLRFPATMTWGPLCQAHAHLGDRHGVPCRMQRCRTQSSPLLTPTASAFPGDLRDDTGSVPIWTVRDLSSGFPPTGRPPGEPKAKVALPLTFRLGIASCLPRHRNNKASVAETGRDEVTSLEALPGKARCLRHVLPGLLSVQFSAAPLMEPLSCSPTPP